MVDPDPQHFEQLRARLSLRLRPLADKPEETVTTTLRALWHLAAGRAVSVDAAQGTALPTLDAAATRRLDELVARRLSGTPLAHMTGLQRFMGLEILCGGEALIPRRETELLGWAALKELRRMASVQEDLVVIDVCSGSGNLAVGLAHHEPAARVFAADLSREAVALALRNVEHLGLIGRVDVREGDLLAPFDQPEFHRRVDLIVCNPPYISTQKVLTMAGEVSDFEPRLAFDGGPLGIRILQRLIREAPRYLKPGGRLAFEVGDGQGPAVLRRLRAQGDFEDAATVTDRRGHIRVILGSRANR